MLQRVLIVDPDPRVRRALRALLETQPDIAVIGEADTAQETLRHAEELHPSIVLLDVMLPTAADGLATIRRLVAGKLQCVATGWQGGLREAALEMGASDFIEKGGSADSLLAAIRGTGSAVA